MQGTVIWFDDAKGYGFLAGENGQDFFCHHSHILSDEPRKTLYEGDLVEFKPDKNSKGVFANDVKRIG